MQKSTVVFILASGLVAVAIGALVINVGRDVVAAHNNTIFKECDAWAQEYYFKHTPFANESFINKDYHDCLAKNPLWNWIGIDPKTGLPLPPPEYRVITPPSN